MTHDEAVTYWFDKLGTPEAVRDEVRKGFRKLRFKQTPEQIVANADRIDALGRAYVERNTDGHC